MERLLPAGSVAPFAAVPDSTMEQHERRGCVGVQVGGSLCKLKAKYRTLLRSLRKFRMCFRGSLVLHDDTKNAHPLLACRAEAQKGASGKGQGAGLNLPCLSMSLQAPHQECSHVEQYNTLLNEELQESGCCTTSTQTLPHCFGTAGHRESPPGTAGLISFTSTESSVWCAPRSLLQRPGQSRCSKMQ